MCSMCWQPGSWRAVPLHSHRLHLTHSAFIVHFTRAPDAARCGRDGRSKPELLTYGMQTMVKQDQRSAASSGAICFCFQHVSRACSKEAAVHVMSQLHVSRPLQWILPHFLPAPAFNSCLPVFRLGNTRDVAHALWRIACGCNLYTRRRLSSTCGHVFFITYTKT